MHLQCSWEKKIIYWGLLSIETISGDALSVGDVPQGKKARWSSLRAKSFLVQLCKILNFKCFGKKINLLNRHII